MQLELTSFIREQAEMNGNLKILQLLTATATYYSLLNRNLQPASTNLNELEYNALYLEKKTWTNFCKSFLKTSRKWTESNFFFFVSVASFA